MLPGVMLDRDVRVRQEQYGVFSFVYSGSMAGEVEKGRAYALCVSLASAEAEQAFSKLRFAHMG